MVVDTNVAADPHVRDVSRAQTIQLACTANAFDGGEHPQCEQDSRIHCVSAHTAFNRFDVFIQRRQIERVHIRPNRAHDMVVIKHLLE